MKTLPYKIIPRNYVIQETEDRVRIPVKSKKMLEQQIKRSPPFCWSKFFESQ